VTIRTVAIQSPGDMGAAVGAFLGGRGLRVVSALEGRSDATRARAERAGIEAFESLGEAVDVADCVLSILPPADALGFAEALVRTTRDPERPLLLVDCNAVSPATASRMAALATSAGATFLDASLIGSPPGRGPAATRLYVSGPAAERLISLGDDPDGALVVRSLGDEVGRASALKMVYAGLTKGTLTLHTAVLIAAQRLGVFPELSAELRASQPEAWTRMGIIPFLPADAGRWVGEMQQIAASFRGTGAPSGFHEAAEAVFRLLDASPFASETRETLDRSRTLEEAVQVFAELAGGDAELRGSTQRRNKR
jgi:3-hydroxyisobutyrate dehydrogenase-like beta-hydroxyacid dehydrogenase